MSTSNGRMRCDGAVNEALAPWWQQMREQSMWIILERLLRVLRG